MKKSLLCVIGCLPGVLYGQTASIVSDPANLAQNIEHFGKQIAHYAKQAEHYQAQADHYKWQIKHYKQVLDFNKQNVKQLKNFNVSEMTSSLRGLLNSVKTFEANEVAPTWDGIGPYGGKRWNTAGGTRTPPRTIKSWENSSLQQMPREFYESKIATAENQMEAIKYASQYNAKIQNDMARDIRKLEEALRDMSTAQGQLEALQAAAKIAGDQAIAIKKIIGLMGVWMDMQAQYYTDRINKETAQDAAWKKQTEFDPGNYVAKPMRLHIK